jgi:thiol-disulfide isomerase/thioredoxin
MSVIGGLIVLVVVLAAASAAGFGLRARQGRFRPQKPLSHQKSQAQRPQSTALPEATDRGDPVPPTAPNKALTAADLGAPLGQRATLVQFSTEFCTYCGPTRELLVAVASERDGVAFVEIDAADRMDLTRRLRVLSTPTVLVLGADGAIERRSSGQPRKSELLEAIGAVLGGGAGS